MRYLILFGIFVALSTACALWCRGKFGKVITIILGAILTIATVVLFFLNKSDSVADTFLEKLADLSPPLITGALVIGWWVGYALYGAYARMTR